MYMGDPVWSRNFQIPEFVWIARYSLYSLVSAYWIMTLVICFLKKKYFNSTRIDNSLDHEMELYGWQKLSFFICVCGMECGKVGDGGLFASTNILANPV